MKRKIVIMLLMICLVLSFSSGVSALDITLKGDSSVTGHIPYMKGYPDCTFRPDKNMTRAEACTVIYNLMKEQPTAPAGQIYSDVKPGEWYVTAIHSLASVGVVSGYPDGNFRPNGDITRAEMTKILTGIYGLNGGSALNYSDLSESHWAYSNIAAANDKGWFSGYPDGTFRPDKPITRAEVATIVNRITDRDMDFYKEGADAGAGCRYYREALRDKLTDMFDYGLEGPHWAFYHIIEATMQMPEYVGVQFRHVETGSRYLVEKDTEWHGNGPKAALNYEGEYDPASGKYDEYESVSDRYIHYIYSEGDYVRPQDFEFFLTDGFVEQKRHKTIYWEDIVFDPNNPTRYKAGENVFKCYYDGYEYTWTVNAVERWGIKLKEDDNVVIITPKVPYTIGSRTFHDSYQASFRSELLDSYIVKLKIGESINLLDLFEGVNCKIISFSKMKVSYGIGTFDFEEFLPVNPDLPFQYDEKTGIVTCVKDDYPWSGSCYSGRFGYLCNIVVELENGMEANILSTVRFAVDSITPIPE